MIVKMWVCRSCVRVSQVLCLCLVRLGWRPTWSVQLFCRRYGKGPAGKGSGLVWIQRMLWVCARQPAFGMFRASTCRTASSSSSTSRRALRSHKSGGIQALRVCRDIESLCFDRVCIKSPKKLPPRPSMTFLRSWEMGGGMSIQG